MVLRNFDLFQQRIIYDPFRQVVEDVYESNEDEVIVGVYKDLLAGKVLFYRLEDQLFIELKGKRYNLRDIKKYEERNQEGVLFLENSAATLKLKEPIQIQDLDDPFTMSANDDFNFLKYIDNVRSSRDKQKIIFTL